MKEFDFIKSITPKTLKQPGIIKGIGDDAAILRYPYEDMIVTVDTMVESVHFSKKTTSPFHIGYRSLAANISDIAAMGGKPAAYLVSIIIPKDWEDKSLNEIYKGMSQLAKEFHMDLIGGDTVDGKQLAVSITVFGTVPRDKARYRNTARDGDIVFVTGTLGGSACGLHVLLNKPACRYRKFQRVINKHQMPAPRVDFIQACQSLDRMALNDVSDGIANEANEIAEASNKVLYLEYDKIPYKKELLHFSEEQQIEWKLSGGEDFEIVGTIAEKDWTTLKEKAKQTNTNVTAIGKVINDPNKNASVWLKKDGKRHVLQKSGYTHLRR